jgi:hypothetical protein
MFKIKMETMELTESEFDKNVIYTLRIELLTGKVLLYPINIDNKKYLIEKLRANSDGIGEKEPIVFLWFETSPNRMVIIDINSISRITFCFDLAFQVKNTNSYFDNFKMLETETSLVEKETEEGKVGLHVIEDQYLPQAIICHSGKAPEDLYDDNPLTYSQLNKACLAGLNIELEGDVPLRQFLYLIDNDGEETFIPFRQITLMEFDCDLLFDEEEDYQDPENHTNLF